MGELLETINSPKDLKNIKQKMLPELAKELREAIVERVSINGGHLSSNLGVIELSIALHFVFNAPKDKIIWDVGHQCYAHKLLTGRRERFHTVRQDGGIGGFPRKEESVFDPVNTGHSGTSISSALAMACARDAKNEKNSVIAIIGDGSMTSGLALEGINNAGAIKTDLIVVLNDNKMSISPNVGALSAHLNRIITGQLYNKMKKEVEVLIKNIPGIGEQVAKFANRLEEGIKGMIVPGGVFEELGFKYVGPIEGHNIPLLIDTFKSVKKLKRPLLIHVVTKKGKGYSPAEKRPENYHGTPKFDIESGKFNRKNSNPTYTSCFSNAIINLAKEDKAIVGITAAMADGTGLDIFARQFPDRFFDVGIAEQHAVTFAAGLALEGFKPVVAIYSTFLQRSYDQIIHDVCMMNLPVIFVMDRAGIVGEDGPTHQGLFDLSFLRHMPNMTIMAPKDENELGHMLKTAFEIKGPVAIRYPRGNGVGVSIEKKYTAIPVGKGEVLREGSDCIIFALGNTVQPSVKASYMLEKDGIKCGVVNVRFAKPIDKELLGRYLKICRCIITVEENVLQGGFGSALLEISEDITSRKAKIKRIGLPDRFIEHASPDILRSRYGLDAEGIASSVQVFYYREGRRSGLRLADKQKKAAG